MKGNISDIETMGLVDGPGMRLVVFLSGCRLRCLYCHNPETWNENYSTRQMTPEELYALYQKYSNYYGANGGVTFSGGEPLIQHDFLLEATKLFHEKGVHVALDTAGCADNYSDILEFVDLVILDIKAVDSKEYKHITGMEQDKFNEFLRVCVEKDKILWLRQVIVPGINDDEAHVLKLKEFARKLKNVERIELLPYHTLGVHKYENLKIPYRLNGTPDMDKERCKELEKLLKVNQ